jgi:hypothetical protein
MAPDCFGAASLTILEFISDDSCAKLGAATREAAPTTVNAAIMVRRFISKLLSSRSDLLSSLGRDIACVALPNVDRSIRLRTIAFYTLSSMPKGFVYIMARLRLT